MKEELEKTPDYSEYEGKTFGQILDGLARDVPDKEMIVFNGERMTYGQFYQKVITVAMALKKLGIKKGDKVAALFPNCPDFFVVQQAVLYIGAVFVLLSTRYREYELSYMLKHSKAKCLFTIDKYLKADFIDIIEKIRPELPSLEFCFVMGSEVPLWGKPFQEALDLGRDLDEKLLREDLPEYDDTASILYSSGSTGQPKGILMTHRAFIFGALQVARRLRITSDDVSLMIVPCSHTLCAFIQFPNALMGRCRIVMLETFEAGQALEMYNKEKISLIYGVPTMFVLMLEHENFAKTDFSSSRAGYTGGAIIPEELMLNVKNKMNCKLVSVYGLSECGACTMNDVEDDDSLKIGTVGSPLDGVDIIIADDNHVKLPVNEVGEVCLKGPNLFSGYYEQPELTKEAYDPNGYFCTGDLGKYLENGMIAIVGRKKEMIIRGGFNVYPAELEEQIRLIDGVQSVAVVGLPDKVMGEKIVACIIPSPGSTITDKEIIAYCKGRMANYKVPNVVVIMDEFPLTALGKVQKFKMIEALEAKGI